ncbi:MAG: 50S ribosome-binding GTPase [Desulfomonile tiedjei]|uniref:50S ribosome-binding GTPase n=1 Tax=Desulfomonile tiedjei TaxID=2358 RepID=A0A9D6V4M2_9BACT|nr:50S ribosome-binding GTPase [Desulfomonile tiedjei]
MLRLKMDGRLTDHELLERKRFEAERLVKAFVWKSGLGADFPPIICLVGGTGTGKSTLFNSLAGRKVSEVGARRPYTLKAVILVHEAWVEQLMSCPFLIENGSDTTLITHSDLRNHSAILVDTPDFDSVQVSNRVIAENFFIICDVMLFVTSQEKYADLAGRKITETASAWKKDTVFVMNKVFSRGAYDDFVRSIGSHGLETRPLLVERLESSPDLIAGLNERPGFADLLNPESVAGRAHIRPQELSRLRSRAASSLEDLESALRVQLERVESANSRIRAILTDVADDMDRQLDALVTDDVEGQIRDRLQNLLRKYDILFVPRMLVRRAVREIFGTIADLFGESRHQSALSERDIRSEDLEQTRSAVRLKPLESAVAALNLRVAEFLASDQSLEDLRRVARDTVPRLGADEIRSRYEETFPGIEHLLEMEFTRFKDGLSSKDELKLYGSYTLWALFIITAEVVMGGGFTLLDALLNTVIMPFIPKWLLNLKVLDVLREIGERVDKKNREALEQILTHQAQLYISGFSGLLPSPEAMKHISDLRSGLSNYVPR